MPVTLAPPRMTPSPTAVDIDGGVIEEARRRQRRRRTFGIAFGAIAAAIAGAALLIGGGDGGNSKLPGESARGGPLKLALINGRAFIGGEPALMGVTPSLQAGNVGVCVRVVSEEGCNGPPPTAADPVYGDDGFNPEEKVGPGGEINAIFTGPGVAAMRVAHLGTFKAQSAPGLPPGAKQIVFYRPAGSRGTVLAPGFNPQLLQGFEHARRGPALTETLLNASGRPIPVAKSSTFTLPNSYWQGDQTPPAGGRCAMSSSLPGVRTEWGQVATKIAGDPSITTPAWFTCLNAWLSLNGASYETAILLDGKSPGAAPAPLWNAIPVPGHPGIVQIPPIEREIRLPLLTPAQASRILAIDTRRGGRARAEQILRESERRTFWDVFIPPTVARRIGPAWVLVRYGNSLTQRIAFLEALHVTKLLLPTSPTSRPAAPRRVVGRLLGESARAWLLNVANQKN